MNAQDASLLRDLLDRSRVLALGVLVDGAPYVGLLPFTSTADRRALLVHASALARHTRGLSDGARCSALLHVPESATPDPLQVPRVTFQGTVQRLETGSPEHAAARARYLARFPESEPTFELPDFALYALRITEGRLVAGFARARNVSLDDLVALR
jgi:putative heme iron utilization protein